MENDQRIHIHQQQYPCWCRATTVKRLLRLLLLISCSNLVLLVEAQQQQQLQPDDEGSTTSTRQDGVPEIGNIGNGLGDIVNGTVVTAPPAGEEGGENPPANYTTNTTTTTTAPVAGAAGTDATVTTAPANENTQEEEEEEEDETTTTTTNTLAPTIPVDSLVLPPAVDIVNCRKHLHVADANRDSLLTEDEYVTFVHQVATHDYGGENGVHALSDLPESQKGLWGNTLRTMPQGIRVLYQSLQQGGAIPIVGYKVEQLPTHQQQQPNPLNTLAHDLFLMKVCVHTEIAVHQIVQQHELLLAEGGGSDITVDTSRQVLSIPKVEILTVYSSMALENSVGIATTNLDPQNSHNRRGLDLAYETLVTKVISEQLNTELASPIPTGEQDALLRRKTLETRQRRRRQLTVALDPQLPEIYRIDDVACDGADQSSELLQTRWCQVGYGRFILYLVGENSLELYNTYSQAVQNATATGELQQILQDVAPNVELVVTDAGPSLLPPPDTDAPTVAPNETATGNNETQPVYEKKEKESNLDLIFIL